MFEILHHGLSDIGRLRQRNEDNWVALPQQGLFLVSDGMGGAAGGALAAQIVVEVLPRLLGQRKLQGRGWSGAEAEAYVRTCGEDEGPESYEEAAELFAALYGRAPDEDDGDQAGIWSLCCAAVQS